jgi:predicted RND superfamily exporter protein/CRP-like cAMP-binding protein
VTAEPAAPGPAGHLARRIVDHPWLVIAAVAVVTATLGAFAPRCRIDSSVGTLLDVADPEVRHYEDVKRTFGNEEIDVLAVAAEDVFAPATLARIAELSARLGRVPGIADVTSVATVRNLGTDPDGALDTGPLMPEVPRDPAEMARLRRTVAQHPLFAGTLVSRDGRMAAIVVRYAPMSDAAFVASGTHEAVERVIADFDGPERIYLTGSPTLKVEAARLMRADLLVFTPGTVLVVGLVMLLAFRTLRGVLIPMGTTALGLLWTLGLMGFFDVPIDVGTLVLPTLLMIIGSTYATHVVARYYEEAVPCERGADVVHRVVRHLGAPVLVTALTTVCGFAALAVYRIAAIRHLGLFMAFGITGLLVLALTFVPAVLTLLPAPAARGGPRGSTRLAGALERLAAFDLRHRTAILAVTAAVLAVCVWGLRFVRIDTSYPSYFPERSPIREAMRAIGAHLGGAAVFLVTVDSPEPGAVTRLDTLRRIAALEDFVDRLPGVDRTTSVVDYVKTLHYALHDDDPAYFGLPDTDAGVQQYLLLLDPEMLEGLVDAEGTRAAIVVRSRIASSRATAEVVEAIGRFAAGAFPSPFTVHTTGTIVLLDRTADALSHGQVQSVVLSLVVVFAVLSLQFLSLRYGLVAMVPNLVPIFVFFGLLGWLDIPLSLATAMIAAISIGLGVDEAVHLLAEFNQHVRREADQAAAVRAALRTVGPPVLYATAALTLGLLVPAWSSFAPIRQFGVLSAVTVAVSLLADLLLLPALLSTARFVTLWDVLTVKLGHAPHETIRLFHGLRPAQARIAAAMGRLRTVPAGEAVVVRGAPGEEMYVVLRGRAAVLAAVDQALVRVETIGRGDVLGEMGLVRHAPRTAEVRALEEIELLVVDERFLRVLRRRYPRIAATVLLNLTRILSDRLQHTTELLAHPPLGSRDTLHQPVGG